MSKIKSIVREAYEELFVPHPKPENIHADSAMFYAGIYVLGLNLPWTKNLYMKEECDD